MVKMREGMTVRGMDGKEIGKVAQVGDIRITVRDGASREFPVKYDEILGVNAEEVKLNLDSAYFAEKTSEEPKLADEPRIKNEAA